MQEHDAHFMQMALAQASIALKADLIPVGAVFAKDQRVIAHARKNGIAHPLFDHAEHNGCYQALWSREGPGNLRGCTVYSTLEPCIMCMSMLMTTRVSRIVFALSDPYGGGKFILENPGILPKRFQDERPVIEGGCLAEESKSLLREYFEGANRQRSATWSNKNNPLVRLVLS